MSIKEKCSKLTGIYKSSDPIDNLKIRVILKKINSFINLPSLNFANSDDEVEIKDAIEEKVFQWQEKIFSSFEVEFYGSSTNCNTDLHRQYHEDIVKFNLNEREKSSKLFTYVNADDYEPIQSLTSDTNPTMTSLHKNMEALRFRNEVRGKSEDAVKVDDDDDVVDYFPPTGLIESHYVNNRHEVMYVMADVGLEYALCTLKWDSESRTLTVYPDFNDLHDNPYVIVVDSDSRCLYHFAIQNASEAVPSEVRMKEIELVNKISKLKTTPTSGGFDLVSRNTLRVHLLLEIVSLEDFEYDNQYVEYLVDLPYGWSCTWGHLQGTTHTAGGDIAGKTLVGHCTEISLEGDLNMLGDTPALPQIFFEVISRDWWNRHRTEGYTCCPLYVTRPCSHAPILRLGCFRPDYRGAAMRRYFLGGCHVIDDVTWLGPPRDAQTRAGTKSVKYGVQTISTGTLTFKYSVLKQTNQRFQQEMRSVEAARRSGSTQRPRTRSARDVSPGRMGGLVRSVQGVIEAYRGAKERLRQARGLDVIGAPHTT